MTLRAALFGEDGRTSGDWLIDARVCDCCQTDAAVVKDGIVVAYRDRTEDEIRDISLVRFDGRAWSEPVLVAADGWRIAGCPVNGPAVAARGDRLAVAWFTAADGVRHVRVALSDDGGRTFGEPVNVDAGAPLGRVDLVLLDDGAVVSWLEQSVSGAAEIRLRSITPAGQIGSMQVLATTSAARSAGFPQMVSSGGRLVFAWTEAAEPSQVKTAILPLL